MKRDIFPGSAFPCASVFVAAAIVGAASQAPLAWSQPQSEEERRKGWGIPKRVDSAPIGMGAPGAITGLAVPGAVGGGKVHSEIGLIAPIVVATPQNVLKGVQGSLSIVLTEIAQGTLTPQQAWNEKRLSPQEILQFLAGGQRLTQNEGNEKLQSELAGVLVQNVPERIQDHRQLPLLVRVALGRYYSSVGDVRAVAIAEALLRELDRKPKQADPWPELWGVILLAKYYRNTEQREKAAQTWERALTYRPDVGRWQASVRVDAARDYIKAGGDEHRKRAVQLFAQVAQYGEDFYTGLVSYDRASFLLEENKPQAAKELLLKDLESLSAPGDRMGPLWTLAQSHWKLEEWEQAEAVLEKMLQAYTQQKTVPKGLGFEEIVGEAQGRLHTLQKWKTKTFELPLPYAMASRDEKGVFHARFYLYSFSKPSIGVRFDDPKNRLVELKAQRQNRANSGVLVNVYDLSFQAPDDGSFQAQVSLTSKPGETQPLEIVWKSADK